MIRRKLQAPRGVLKDTPADHVGITHARFHPSDDLSPWIEHHWTVSWDMGDGPPHAVATLPHPNVYLIFEAHGGDGIAGPSRARFSRHLEGRDKVYAVKFRPGGFQVFGGGEMARFADRVLPIATVFGADGDALRQSVLESEDIHRRIEMVEAFLRAQRPVPDPEAQLAAELVEAVAREPGLTKVADLVDRSGRHVRSLQRLFARYVGVSPKWVIQRYRLHEAAERLAAGPIDQAQLAFELGYSDQAHFIRDFKALVGMTPAAYARAAGAS